jgi:hypothetical protein
MQRRQRRVVGRCAAERERVVGIHAEQKDRMLRAAECEGSPMTTPIAATRALASHETRHASGRRSDRHANADPRVR